VDEIMKQVKPGGPTPFYVFMYGEVQQALVDHGYWSFVEAANISNTMERRAARKRVIAKQQAKHQHLYEISIESLGLSSRALNALQRVSITSVGDCIKFFAQTHEDDSVDSVAYRDKLDWMAKTASQVPFFVYMFVEVESIIKERGYWSFVEETAASSDIKRPDVDKMTYGALSTYHHLFEVPIEHLKLSVRGSSIIRRLGITTVGDCVDFYRRGMEGSASVAIRQQSVQIMYGEVQLKMKEYGYWSFIEAAPR
jgi:DNA-directed RNA polymerase alpha subunit